MCSLSEITRQFEQSPFGPLSDHMAKVKECVALVEPMISFLRQGDYNGLQAMTEQVFKLEHEADMVKDEIRQCIPKSFYLPIYRGDLLAYLKLQDGMADAVEDVAAVITIKRLEMPEAIAEDVANYTHKVLKVCNLLFKCTDQIVELTELDFNGGPRAREILELVSDADRAEWEADKTQYVLAQKLFALEDELRATDIFLWSHAFRELGKLANNADKTGERLRRMLVK